VNTFKDVLFVSLGILSLGTSLTYVFSDHPSKSTKEERVKAIHECSGQRIGDPAFRFPYDMPCDEWVKIKVGDTEDTRQFLDEYKKNLITAEKEEWGN